MWLSVVLLKEWNLVRTESLNQRVETVSQELHVAGTSDARLSRCQGTYSKSDHVKAAQTVTPTPPPCGTPNCHADSTALCALRHTRCLPSTSYSVKRDFSDQMKSFQSSMLQFRWVFANCSRNIRCCTINIRT